MATYSYNLQNIFDNAKRYANKIEIDLGVKNNE